MAHPESLLTGPRFLGARAPVLGVGGSIYLAQNQATPPRMVATKERIKNKSSMRFRTGTVSSGRPAASCLITASAIRENRATVTPASANGVPTDAAIL